MGETERPSFTDWEYYDLDLGKGPRNRLKMRMMPQVAQTAEGPVVYAGYQIKAIGILPSVTGGEAVELTLASCEVFHYPASETLLLRELFMKTRLREKEEMDMVLRVLWEKVEDILLQEYPDIELIAALAENPYFYNPEEWETFLVTSLHFQPDPNSLGYYVKDATKGGLSVDPGDIDPFF